MNCFKPCSYWYEVASLKLSLLCTGVIHTPSQKQEILKQHTMERPAHLCHFYKRCVQMTLSLIFVLVRPVPDHQQIDSRTIRNARGRGGEESLRLTKV